MTTNWLYKKHCLHHGRKMILTRLISAVASLVLLLFTLVKIIYFPPLIQNMWWDTLPSLGIMVACMAAPHYCSYLMNWAVLGNMFRRATYDQPLRLQYLRDLRLTGDAYGFAGLDKIPDEDDDECDEDDDVAV